MFEDSTHSAAHPFDPLQLDLPLALRSLSSPQRFDCSEEWRFPEKVLVEYLEALGVVGPCVIAKTLLGEFGSLPDMLAASRLRLSRLTGIRLASVLASSHDLMRAAMSEPIERGPIVPRSSEFGAFLQAQVGFLPYERVLALYVDSKMHLLRIERIADGSIGESSGSFRKVIDVGMCIGASGFLLVHNHPSGDPTPSQTDLATTTRLQRLAGELDMRLIDHLIVARGRVGSIFDFWREAEWARHQ